VTVGQTVVPREGRDAANAASRPAHPTLALEQGLVRLSSGTTLLPLLPQLPA
jgi:hypothetical protein